MGYTKYLNKMMNNDFENFKRNNEEIDLRLIFKTFLREKKLILTITILSAISSCFFSIIKKPLWSGSFEIVTKQAKENLNRNILLDNLNIGGLNLDNSNQNETQKLILKSELVLLPVFEFVKSEYIKKGKDVSKMQLKEWIKKDLNIDYEKNSNVLFIRHKNSDKKLIIKTLNLISQKYKEYSKRDIMKNLQRTIFYLEKQKEILSERSLESMKKYNKFAIENNLGNFDGFAGIVKYSDASNSLLNDIYDGLESKDKINLDLISENINLQTSGKSSAGERYKIQFNKLELYEAQYADLSSKFKTNSDVLTNLKLKIENIKAQLKRPNEILIEHKNLLKIANRDDSLLNKVESNLELAKLQQINSPQAWELISTPKIDQKSIWPQRVKIVFLLTIFSFIISMILALFKEKLSGILYEKKFIIDKLKINLVDNLLKNNPELNTLIIKKLYGDSKELVFINYKSKVDTNFLEEIIEAIPISIFSKFEDVSSKKIKSIYILIEEGKFLLKDIEIINAYIQLYPEKIAGLISVE